MLPFASPRTLNCLDWGWTGVSRGCRSSGGDVEGERTRSLPGAAGGTGGGGGGGGEERGGRFLAEPDLSHSLSSQRRVGGARQLNLRAAPELLNVSKYSNIS